MTGRGGGTPGVSTRGKDGRRWLGCAVAAMLALAGCSSGSPVPNASPAEGSPSTAPASPYPSTRSTGLPAKAFTDAELAAIINGVGQSRNLSFPAAQDSARLRSGASSGASSGAFPRVTTETNPDECAAFVPQNPFVRWADKTAGFAEGGIPLNGQSGPTSTIMVVLRSAEKDAIATADFNYTADLSSRCTEFDLSSIESGQTSTYAVKLLAVGPIGDKQYGLMQSPKPTGPGDYGTAGLRVLAGTLSITLTLAVAELTTESDAKPALDTMADLAGELISQAAGSPPTVTPPPKNPLTAEQMVALFKDVPGPNGQPAALPGASVIGPPPGFSPGPSSPASAPACTFDDESYLASLAGSVVGQGQIQGASKIDYTEFTAISMPVAAAVPYAFDRRARDLRDCSSIQENVPGGVSRPWSAVAPLKAGIDADASYAVVYRLSDGTGEWHVRSGARRGTLSIEASSRTTSQGETQAIADGHVAFFGKVFARAGL